MVILGTAFEGGIVSSGCFACAGGIDLRGRDLRAIAAVGKKAKSVLFSAVVVAIK